MNLLEPLRKEDVMNLKEHYLRFLDYNNERLVFSQLRDEPINHQYFYRVIATEINGQNFYSVSPSLKDEFKVDDSIEKTLQINQRHYKRRAFFRMMLEKFKPLKVNESQVWTHDDLEKHLIGLSEDEKMFYRNKHRSVLDDKRRFYISKNNEKVVYGKISDIVCGGGNIAVYTSPKHRHQGYGKMVVSSCIEWCTKHNIIPVYLVDIENKASIALAESLGFRVFSKEYVLSEEIPTVPI